MGRTVDIRTLDIIAQRQIHKGLLAAGYSDEREFGGISLDLVSGLNMLSKDIGSFIDENEIQHQEVIDYAKSLKEPLLIPKDGETAKIIAALRQYTPEGVCPLVRSGNGYECYNIVYIEDTNAKFARITPTPDKFDDLRLVMQAKPIGDGSLEVSISYGVVCTTQPGKFYTEKPLNKNGAAIITPGFHKAWKSGMHNGDHPALVQRAKILVHRDSNKNHQRDDKTWWDVSGLNHHSTSAKFTPERIGKYSAGCLVAQSMPRHLHFMNIILGDYRYEQNNDHMYSSYVIPSSVFHK